MPYSQDVKELAYTIDPVAFVSYSGKPRNFKAAMDFRRDAALREAQGQIDRVIERRNGGRRTGSFTEEPLDNFMVEFTSKDGTHSVEYSDSLSLGDDINQWINDGRTIKRIIITPN